MRVKELNSLIGSEASELEKAEDGVKVGDRRRRRVHDCELEADRGGEPER